MSESPNGSRPSGTLGPLPAILEDIRFEQTLFSLPFLALAALLAADGWPSLRTGLLMVVALVAARSAAMATNRVADAEIDARNARTAGRAVPAGRVSRRAMTVFAVVSVVAFAAAAAALNPLCLALTPVALLFLLGYSWTKRITPLCHLILGTTIGIAPLGAWAAVKGSYLNAAGEWDWIPWLLAGGVALWVAGFDVIYASPDADSDAAEGLHSIPKALGVRAAFGVAAGFHAVAVLAFAAMGARAELETWWWVGLALGGLVLLAEHLLVRPGRYARMSTAFFRLNAVFSGLLLTAGAIDVFSA